MDKNIFNLIMDINVLYYVDIEDRDPKSAIQMSLDNVKKADAIVYDTKNRRSNRERF